MREKITPEIVKLHVNVCRTKIILKFVKGVESVNVAFIRFRRDATYQCIMNVITYITI